MKKIVEILADKQALTERALVVVLEKMKEAIATRGRVTIALAGGSTPKSLYEDLARQNLPWEKVEVFWGDERYVSSTHPDSNQKMAREAWLDQVNFSVSNLHPMPTGAENPILDAQQYEQELREFFQLAEGEFPVFDLILLGMGDDGHTASLFPHTEALEVRDKLIAVGNKDGQPRLTFTFPLINAARCVIFLVAGSNKKLALAEVFAEEGDEMAYPSRLIQPQGELWWLLEQAAGEDLKT